VSVLSFLCGVIVGMPLGVLAIETGLRIHKRIAK